MDSISSHQNNERRFDPSRSITEAHVRKILLTIQNALKKNAAGLLGEDGSECVRRMIVGIVVAGRSSLKNVDDCMREALGKKYENACFTNGDNRSSLTTFVTRWEPKGNYVDDTRDTMLFGPPYERRTDNGRRELTQMQEILKHILNPQILSHHQSGPLAALTLADMAMRGQKPQLDKSEKKLLVDRLEAMKVDIGAQGHEEIGVFACTAASLRILGILPPLTDNEWGAMLQSYTTLADSEVLNKDEGVLCADLMGNLTILGAHQVCARLGKSGITIDGRMVPKD